MSALLCALLIAAHPQDVQEEQADIADKLETERLALEALKSSKGEVLRVVDELERMMRGAEARVDTLRRSVKALQTRVERSRLEAKNAHEEVAQRQASLAPRLLTLYRLLKEGRLHQWVSAQSFGTLMRRERALASIVQVELTELENVSRLSRYAERQEHRLELLETSARSMLQTLSSEQSLAQGRRAALDDVLRTLNAETSRSNRLVKELERAEAELSSMVSDLKVSGLESGLRGRKGNLPFPTRGMVEVGFGKVVNPRFNTVTTQKGIDIRAPMGSQVRSVGVGTVAYVGWLKGYGNLVIVDHGGDYHSLYAHLKDVAVEVGVEVEEGEDIATVGDTGSLKGSYLYFEIRRAGVAIDPIPWFESLE